MLLYSVFTASRPLLAPIRPSHIHPIPILSEPSPLFAAYSKTSQKSGSANRLTPFFSISPLPILCSFLTLKEINLAFTSTSKNMGWVPPLPPESVASLLATHLPLPPAPLSRSGHPRYHVCGLQRPKRNRNQMTKTTDRKSVV